MFINLALTFYLQAVFKWYMRVISYPLFFSCWKYYKMFPSVEIVTT